MGTFDELRAALADPFPLAALGWKPQAVKGNRALAVAYIDARDVMDRLDAVVGPENWQDDFLPLPDGQVVCRLSLRVNGEWVTKQDVGGESEQPDGDDRKKAAFSDALKRAAVKWGVGRYLYSMPSQWCDYDPAKKSFTQVPQVAARFLPAAKAPARQLPPVLSPEDDARCRLRAVNDLAALGAVWDTLPPAIQRAVEKDKDRRKTELMGAAPDDRARRDELALACEAEIMDQHDGDYAAVVKEHARKLGVDVSKAIPALSDLSLAQLETLNGILTGGGA